MPSKTLGRKRQVKWQRLKFLSIIVGGLRKRIEESKAGSPGIAGERFFIAAMKIGRKYFPTTDDLDECFSAFMKGFSTDPK